MSVHDGARLPARLLPLVPLTIPVVSPFGNGRGITRCEEAYCFEAENAFLMGSRKAGLERLVDIARAGFVGAPMRELIEIARDYDPVTDRFVGQIERAAAQAALAAGSPSLLPGYAVTIEPGAVIAYVVNRLQWRVPPEVAAHLGAM